MCKEVDEKGAGAEGEANLPPPIPEGLPEPGKLPVIPKNALTPPEHNSPSVEGKLKVGTLKQYDDLPLSDINENSKAI